MYHKGIVYMVTIFEKVPEYRSFKHRAPVARGVRILLFLLATIHVVLSDAGSPLPEVKYLHYINFLTNEFNGPEEKLHSALLCCIA
jgi:hypothetical protein